MGSFDDELSGDIWIKAIKGKRYEILEFLENFEEGKTFKEITSELEEKPTTLAYHLKMLRDHSLIDRHFQSREGRRDYSVYSITEKGIKGLDLIREIPERLSVEDKLPGLGIYPERIEIIQDTRRPRSFRIEKIREEK